MQRRPKVLWVAESEIDGEILRHPATGQLIVGTNYKIVKDEANNLTRLFKIVGFDRKSSLHGRGRR